MFNFLVTGSPGAWDRRFYEWEKGRILEFTAKSIETALEKLSRDDLNTMMSYPCLFAYEGSEHGMRVGRIIDFKIRPSTVLIEFVLDESIPEIRFSSISPLFELLDIRKWEMSRTNWAVKEEDLAHRLEQHQVVVFNVPSPSLAKKGLPPKPPADTSTHIGSLQDFISELENGELVSSSPLSRLKNHGVKFRA
jgi:hypothetical protein